MGIDRMTESSLLHDGLLSILHRAQVIQAAGRRFDGSFRHCGRQPALCWLAFVRDVAPKLGEKRRPRHAMPLKPRPNKERRAHADKMVTFASKHFYQAH